MDTPISLNPARNPAFKPGYGKYDKDFLLSFRGVFTRPPVELDSNLRRAGVTRPLATPPRRNVPSIAVTPPAEREVSTIWARCTRSGGRLTFISQHVETTASDAAKLIREKSIAFIRNRTEERLGTEEAEMKQRQEDLDRQRAELEQQKRDLDEERTQLYKHCIDLQSRLHKRFQNLRIETENFEKGRLENMAQILTEKAQLENAKRACTDLQTEAWMSRVQSEQMKDNMVATAKRILAFFQVKDNITEELSQRALATLEAEIIAVEWQVQDRHSLPGTQHSGGSQSELQPLFTSDLVVPRRDTNGLILITGIPRGLEQDEVVRAVGSISGNTIRVYSLLPGSPTMIALAYFVGYPDKFFEGNFYVAKDSEMQSIGRVRLHFVSGG